MPVLHICCNCDNDEQKIAMEVTLFLNLCINKKDHRLNVTNGLFNLMEDIAYTLTHHFSTLGFVPW